MYQATSLAVLGLSAVMAQYIPAPTPAAVHYQPHYQPQGAYHQPQEAYHQPQEAYHQPQEAYHQPQGAYHQPQEAYHQPSTGYGAAAPAHYDQYGNPAPAYKEPEPAGDPKQEFEQFWYNTKLCEAEYGLETCLLDCSSISTFFSGQRISGCVVKFVNNLCGSFKEDESAVYANGRVTITTDSCQTSAYANAILNINEMVKNYELVLFGALSHDSWSFTTVKLAIDAIQGYTDCVTDAFFYYITQCTKHNYMDEDAAQCLEEHLEHEACEYAKSDYGKDFNIAKLLSELQSGSADAIKYIKKYYGNTLVTDALKVLLEAYQSEIDTVHTMDVGFHRTKRLASVDVCPANYLWMNYGYDEYHIQGIPEDCVAFHFPRDPPKYKDYYDKKPYVGPAKPSYQGPNGPVYTAPVNGPTAYGSTAAPAYAEPAPPEPAAPKPAVPKYTEPAPPGLAPPKTAAPKPAAPADAEPAPPAYDALLEDDKVYAEEYIKMDPFTPKGGLGEVCKQHYWVSKSLWTLVEYDMGDWCYTINEYNIEFLETGAVEKLNYEYIQDHHGVLPTEEEESSEDYDSTPYGPLDRDYAPCYNVEWRAQKSCTAHLSRWRMNVQCCRGYKTVLDENRPTHEAAHDPYAYPGSFPQPHYAPQQPAQYPPQPAQYPQQPFYPQQHYVQPPPEVSIVAPPAYTTNPPYAAAALMEDNYTPEPTPYVAPVSYDPTPTPYVAPQPQYVPPQPQYVPPQYAQPAHYATPAPYHGRYSAEEYEYDYSVYSNDVTGRIEEYYDGYNNIDNYDLAEIFRVRAEAFNAAILAADEVKADHAELEKQFVRAYWEKHAPPKEKVYTLTLEKPKVPQKKKHSYYVAQDKYAANTCKELQIDLDFTEVVPLVIGECYPQSCVLSQYASCLENPKESHKVYEAPAPVTKAAPQYAPQAYGYNGYRSMMADGASSSSILSVVGFVAGMVVVAVAQFALTGRRAVRAIDASALV